MMLAPSVTQEIDERTRQLIEHIKQMNLGSMLDVRALEDGTIIGIGPLLFTTAIYFDLNEWGFSRRFCFDKHDLALEQYNLIKTGDDEPTGWIATRPKRPEAEL